MRSNTGSSRAKTAVTTQSHQIIQGLSQAKNNRPSTPASSTNAQNSKKQEQSSTELKPSKYSKESYPLQQRHVIESSIAGIGSWIQGPIQARADRRAGAPLAAQYNRDVEIYTAASGSQTQDPFYTKAEQLAAASLGHGYTGTGHSIQAWEPSTGPWNQSQHSPDHTAQPYHMTQHWLDSSAQDQLDIKDEYGHEDAANEEMDEDDWSVAYYETTQ